MRLLVTKFWNNIYLKLNKPFIKRLYFEVQIKDIKGIMLK